MENFSNNSFQMIMQWDKLNIDYIKYLNKIKVIWIFLFLLCKEYFHNIVDNHLKQNNKKFS